MLMQAKTETLKTETKELHNICCLVHSQNAQQVYPLVIMDFQGSLFISLSGFKQLVNENSTNVLTQPLSEFDRVNLSLWIEIYPQFIEYYQSVQIEQNKNNNSEPFLNLNFAIWLLRKLYISKTRYSVSNRLLKQLSATYSNKKAFKFLTQESPIVVCFD
jgi:hypothetical protein